MNFPDLEGELVALQRVGYRDFVWLDHYFTDPELYGRAARWDQHDTWKVFDYCIQNDWVQVWFIVSRATNERLGLLTFSFSTRYFAHVHLYFFSGTWDVDITRDALLSVTRAVFAANADAGANGRAPEGRMELLLPDSVPPDIHEMLTECGFDRLENPEPEWPGDVVYAIFRPTFDAYYGEEAGGS